jgi:putative peptidoglycan lipid II flippase
VTWLFYADRLMEFPTALLGVALGVVLTPQLAAAKAGMAALLRHAGLGPAPGAAAGRALRRGLLAFATPLVATLFHRGALHDSDVGRLPWR